MAIKHFPFGSSTAARTDACHAWRVQSEGIPRKESTYAIDGTVVHGVLEAIALEEAIPDIVEGHKVEKEHRELAFDMWKATKAVLREHNITEYEPEVTATTAEDVGGTLDLVGTCGTGAAMLLDYKTGRGVEVEAVGNKQILFAAANCLYGESSASDLVVGCDRFVGVIIQPNQAGELQTKVWEFTRDVLDAWWKEHQDNIEIARQADMDMAPVAGPHCKFCPANGMCDATTGNLLRMKQIDPEDVEQLKWALDMCEEVEATIKKVKQLAFEQLEVGVEIPGWKLVRGRPGNLAWDDNEAALKLLKRLTRGKKTEDGERLGTLVEVKKLITPTQAKKLLKEHDIPANVLDECTHRPEPKNNVLAPESDKREAVLSADAFAQALNSIS